MERSCGILLPVSALPGPFGIGTLGREAREFPEFLASAGQRWWQMLPVGPTGYGDSPYQSFSVFAGNPYFVDPLLLAEDGLLTEEEIRGDWGDDPARVDYGALYAGRFELLAMAAERGWERDRAQVAEFEALHSAWLPDYALFMALKRRFGMKPWYQWEDEGARLHRPEALERWRRELAADVRMFTYAQYQFFRQWAALRACAAERGIGLIGDLPIYAALDSADVWASPELFQLDMNNVPTAVAGVPPDYFSADGQLWGNPLYDWEAMARDGYAWWIRRVGCAAKLFDALRLDHFRGFESYWAVPYGETTAKNGRWVKGPGMDLIGRLQGWFPGLQFIAEDLGILTPEVHDLLEASGLPGMQVLEFAFDPDEPSAYLPHAHSVNSVCYTGTHDNAPLSAWCRTAPAAERDFAMRYLGVERPETLADGILRGGMSSAAALFLAQMQDYLGLGEEARMNTPGKAEGNWCWRMTAQALTPELAERIAQQARMYGRTPEKSIAAAE